MTHFDTSQIDPEEHTTFFAASPTFRAIQVAIDRPPGTLRYLKGGERYEANDVYEFTDPRGYYQVRVVGAPDSLTKPGSLVTMQAVYQTRPRRYGA